MVTDFLDGALSPADRTAVEAHLADCDDCTEYIAQLRDLIARNAARLDQPGIPVNLPPGLLGKLMNAYRRRSDRH
jgi:predicted anti-sigma-YlaC factor YlaD